jgi:excisionase family DNA binding protein
MGRGRKRMVTKTKNSLLTTTEVAKMLHLHINTVRRWSNQGILKPYRIGPRADRRFNREDIILFLHAQQPNSGFNSSIRDVTNQHLIK